MTEYTKYEIEKLCNMLKNRLLFELRLNDKLINRVNFNIALITSLRIFEQTFDYDLSALNIINILKKYEKDLDIYIIENNINKNYIKPIKMRPFSKYQLKFYTKYNQKEAIIHFGSYLNYIFNIQELNKLNFNESLRMSIDHIENHQYILTCDDTIKGLEKYIEKYEN